MRMEWQTILGLSVLGAIVTTAGSLLATVVKDFFFARSLEKWKARQQLRQVYLGLRGIVWVKNADFEPETPLPMPPGKGPDRN